MELRLSFILLRYFRKLCFDLVRGEGFPRDEEVRLRRHLEGFFNRVEEAFFLDRDGRVENLNRSAAALLGEDTLSARIEGTGILLTDHARRREAEETLQVVLEEMEARVAERAAEAGGDLARRRESRPPGDAAEPTGTPTGNS